MDLLRSTVLWTLAAALPILAPRLALANDGGLNVPPPAVGAPANESDTRDARPAHAQTSHGDEPGSREDQIDALWSQLQAALASGDQARIDAINASLAALNAAPSELALADQRTEQRAADAAAAAAAAAVCDPSNCYETPRTTMFFDASGDPHWMLDPGEGNAQINANFFFHVPQCGASLKGELICN